ncbi:MAG: hypothetical protein ACKVUS_04395 [Saprospiraceae bacterium]
MKNFAITLLLALSSTVPCLAQDNDPLDTPPPRLIVQTGIGLQWFSEVYKLSSVSAERPLGHYWHVGLQGSFYFQNNEDIFYSREFLGGYEVGVFSKYFLHGRFSGRKTGLYLGPEIRFGTRRFQTAFVNVFPPPPEPPYIAHKEKVTKILLRWGVQWQFGHANLEIAAPFGMESYNSTEAYSANGDRKHFVILPTLQMGLAF